MSGDYCSVVRDIVTARWSHYGAPLQYDVNDYLVGTEFFTKIALEDIRQATTHHEEDRKEPPHGEGVLSRHPKIQKLESADPTVDKIKLFIEARLDRFFEMYRARFPFAYVDAMAAQTAMRRSFDTHTSILAHFSPSREDEQSTQALETCLSNLFRTDDISVGLKVCADLKCIYLKGNGHAGYYLLWLIKQASGASFNIPPKESFTHATVTEVLSQFVEGPVILESPMHFINILLHEEDPLSKLLLYGDLVDERYHRDLLNFAVISLTHIPMNVWPRKLKVVLNLFERMSRETNLSIATALTESQDPMTAGAGRHIAAALRAHSLTERIPHFYGLQQLFPDFNDTYARNIFNCHFKPFRKRFVPRDDPPWTRRLSFDRGKEVFIHGSLMIGVTTGSFLFSNEDPPMYILAYDRNNEKMVWGVGPSEDRAKEEAGPLPLNLPLLKDGQYGLTYNDRHIALQCMGDKNVYFIDPETGQLSYLLETAYAPQDLYSCDGFHKSSMGFSYQLVPQEGGYLLIGRPVGIPVGQNEEKEGSVRENLVTNFQVFFEGSFSSLLPLSTHCGVDRNLEVNQGGLVLLGPTGNRVTFPQCREAKALDNKLYLIEQDVEDKNKCHLTIRDLKLDLTVVSDIEQNFVLNVPEASFGKVCKNGLVTLLSGNTPFFAPIFINLQSGEVIYGPRTFLDRRKYVISDFTGDLWSWDASTQKLYKTSATQQTLMGSLSGSRDTTLHYVDQDNHLYLTG